MFARRTGWSLAPNLLAVALEERRRSGRRFLDLTLSNPTRAGLEYPSHEIAQALAPDNPHVYEPDPIGSLPARVAVSRWYARRGFEVDPGHIVLTPGTSESYAWLFKLLCDPGDRVLVPRPSYPLFEFLALLESVDIRSYLLRREMRWEIDAQALRDILMTGGPPTRALRASTGALPQSDRPPPESRGYGPIRAIVAVNPNNPTGSYLSESEARCLREHARERNLALISDEVFFSYPLEVDPSGPLPIEYIDRTARSGLLSLLGNNETPTFVLDGLSKSAGLPGMKVGWIVVQGPPAFRDDALARLEMIADTYLSVGSVVQHVLPRLIELGAGISEHIRERLRSNLAHLRSAVPSGSACEVLGVEGGWSAILRVPRTAPDEDLCLELLEKDDVLVQPGWFFDFESDGYLVMSLLVPEAACREGVSRILARVL